MTLESTHKIVNAAAQAGRGAGAFNVIQIELAEALTAGAADAHAPVILQISENAVKYHGSLEPSSLATLAIARASEFPVAVHLDHAESVDLIHEAVDLGFTSVMFDGSTLDYDANVALTAELAAYCHERGVGIEAELGEVGGKDGVHAPGVRTDPAEAAEFVAATGVDALAVAVGSSHAMTSRDAKLDLELIAAIRQAVPVPLVLHGSSGVAAENLTKAGKEPDAAWQIANQVILKLIEAIANVSPGGHKSTFGNAVRAAYLRVEVGQPSGNLYCQPLEDPVSGTS